VPLERFSASWREQYVESATIQERLGEPDVCVFCELAKMDVSIDTGVLLIGEHTFVCLNAFPYGSGHLLVVPKAHVPDLEALSDAQSRELFSFIARVSRALRAAYQPDGLNIGMNIGRAGGAGIPSHLHAHELPRWSGDTNFMATIGEVRVLPESLASTWQKVHDKL
jgi:ATP adenylyltransferase